MQDKRINELDHVEPEEITGDLLFPTFVPSDPEASDGVTKSIRYDELPSSGGGGSVDSVNGKTGAVVLNADDISDATTTNKFVSQSSVSASGATMDADTSLAGNGYFLDEDNMTSNSATKVPSQQSVKAYVDNRTFTKPDLISSIVWPMYISHRNSPRIYPEESMEGQRLAGELGFPIEVDISALSDGTLVACHDNTVDRTMENISTGTVASKTPQQWRQARIKPAVAGGRTGTPIFFDQYLDEFGGKYLLIPEIKPAAYSYASDIIDAIKARNLEKAAIVQAGDFTVASQVAAAGLESLYLFAAAPAETPAAIAAAGIKYVCGNSSMTNTLISNLKAAGLKVIMFTINTISGKNSALITKGCDGIFTDDPNYVSETIKQSTGHDFSDGYGWPGIKLRNNITPNSSAANNIKLSGNAVLFNVNTEADGNDYAYITSLGKISVPFRVTVDVHIISAGTQTRSFGVILYKNTLDPDADFFDSAYAGQEGFTAIGRANGQLQAYKYVGGAAASSVGNTPGQSGSAQFAEAGKQGFFTLDLLVTSTNITVSTPQKGYTFTVADTFNPTNMNLLVRTAGDSISQISNIRVERL